METYFNDPSNINLNYLKYAMESSLRNNGELRNKLKELESTMKVFKDFYQTNGIDKTELCTKLQDTPYSLSKDCFCAGEPVWYCNGIMHKEMTDFIKSKGESYFLSTNATSNRRRRSTCQIGFGNVDPCRAFDCCNVLGPVDFCVNAEACTFSEIYGDAVQNAGKVNYRASTNMLVNGSVCNTKVPGLLQQTHYDKLIAWDGCLPKATYYCIHHSTSGTHSSNIRF